MQILVINNDGGGFADYIDIPEGTTVKKLFTQQIGSADPSAYLIRVNRQPVPADHRVAVARVGFEILQSRPIRR